MNLGLTGIDIDREKGSDRERERKQLMKEEE